MYYRPGRRFYFTDEEQYRYVRQAAIQEMKKFWAGTFIPALFSERIYTPALSAQNGEAVGADTIAEKTCISADPKVHVDFARQYIDLGFTHLVYHCAGPDQKAFIEGYGRDVLPRIREAVSQKMH
jgi:coenzyme F420-dependent glucose-6-phosphate dehydrogenase